ncbi:MAG: hypothetical protein IIA14_14060 [SAR324 cluster bacterium]|nr:hypothetical protein [SAR324 cluster bacterium]
MFERSVQQGFEKFAEVLENGLKDIRSEIALVRSEMREMEARLEGRLIGRIESARADLLKSQNEMLFKMFGIVVGVVSLAVAVIKLFPNLY